MAIFKENPFRPAADAPLDQGFDAYWRTAILAGELLGEMKLPSTHVLADEPKVARKMVLNAYAQLTAERHAERTEGRGTYVADVLSAQLLPASGRQVATPAEPPNPAPPEPFLSPRAKAQLTAAQGTPYCRPPLTGDRVPLAWSYPPWAPFPTNFDHVSLFGPGNGQPTLRRDRQAAGLPL